jgi:hypothetical protein
MNEIQIIQNQLATERLHFSEVANVCSAALGNGSFDAGNALAPVCADYFAFAVTRFNSSQKTNRAAAKLDVARAVPGNVERWREFLRVFEDESRRYFGAIDELLTRNLPVTEWRAVSKIDADSIFAERARYARIKAALPQ